MKNQLKSFVIFALSIYIAYLINDNIIFVHQYKTLLWMAFILVLGNIIIKPLVKFLLFPINALTLGTARFLAGILTIWLLTFSLNSVKVLSFHFSRATIFSQAIPAFQLNQNWSLLLFSVIIFIISSLLSWIFK